MAGETTVVDLGQTGKDLAAIAEREGLDGGYGEFEELVGNILAARYDMTPEVFNSKYTWEQPDFAGPVTVTMK